MTRPNLPAAVASVVQAEHVPMFPLLKMEFDSETVYLSGTDFPVEYDGHTWLAVRGLGSIEPIIESPSEVRGLRFTLSGVPEAALAEAQSEQYQGRRVTVLWAFLDGDTLRVDPVAWQGRLDVPTIVREPGGCRVSVTAEHRMADWSRPRRLLFNHADQQRVQPGDNFFLGIEAMAERSIVLFSKEAMRQ